MSISEVALAVIPLVLSAAAVITSILAIRETRRSQRETMQVAMLQSRLSEVAEALAALFEPLPTGLEGLMEADRRRKLLMSRYGHLLPVDVHSWLTSSAQEFDDLVGQVAAAQAAGAGRRPRNQC